MSQSSTPALLPSEEPRRWSWVLLLVAISVGFAFHAWIATHQKSPTFDEPANTMASWLAINRGDFRLSPEHPPLWRYIDGLPLWRTPLNMNLDAGRALAVFTTELDDQWFWAAHVMSAKDRNDGLGLIARARLMTCVFPFFLALIVGRWAWAWAGPSAGVLAAALLSFDTNLLAHGGLATNDVPATCIFAAAALLTWRLGERFCASTALLLLLTCAAGIATKMSCLLLAPMVGVPLMVRALESDPWKIGRTRAAESRSRRLALSLGWCVVAAIVSLALLWPLYQFRYAPSRDGHLFGDQARKMIAINSVVAEDLAADRNPEETDVMARAKDYHPSLVDAATQLLAAHHLVPQAWTVGLDYTRGRSLIRASYLMSDYSDAGFRSYFPLAILFKTPLTTLVLAVGALGVFVLRQRAVIMNASRRWKFVCLVVPPAIYLGVSIVTNLNIGIRHVLPIYPALYVGIAVAITHAMRGVRSVWPRIAMPAAATALLACETLLVFPNYVAFFNAPSGGARGGLALLGDSNLDWGQDLPALAAWYRPWRAAHPNDPFYLSYFGAVDPALYGIDSINAVPGYTFAATRPTMEIHGGVYAVSATHLQSIYSPALREAMSKLRQREHPLAIINDTIYVYAMAPTTRPTSAPSLPNAHEERP